MNSGTPPGGLLGTADACPEPLPYQDPSARRFATALMLSICVSAPVFLLQSAVQSVCVSLPLALSLKTLPYQTKTGVRRLLAPSARLLILMEAGLLVARVCEIFALLTSPICDSGSSRGT